MTTSAPHNHSATALPAGAPAPDFGLHSTPDQTVRLSEFRGQPVVLAFYPADWSPVCGDQMALYVSPVGVNPGADGILSALEELQNKAEVK